MTDSNAPDPEVIAWDAHGRPAIRRPTPDEAARGAFGVALRPLSRDEVLTVLANLCQA